MDDAKEEASRIIKRAREEAELEKKHAMDDMEAGDDTDSIAYGTKGCRSFDHHRHSGYTR